MTAGDAMRGLFKAIGDYVRSTSTPGSIEYPNGLNLAAVNEIKTAHRAGAKLPHGATYRKHSDGTGFTIDGSRRPGDPTRPGEQNTGAFLGLQSGHARAEIQALKDRIDFRLNDALCDLKPGEDDSQTGFNECWDIVRALFDDALKGR